MNERKKVSQLRGTTMFACVERCAPVVFAVRLVAYYPAFEYRKIHATRRDTKGTSERRERG